jgi:hypothetical protein
MTSINRRMFDRELKKGSAELIILSIVETRPRHGYEISQQIEQRSAGQLKFHIASLYPLLYRLEERGWLLGPLGREDGPAPAPLLPTDTRRAPRAGQPAQYMADVRGVDWRQRAQSPARCAECRPPTCRHSR